MIAIFDKEGNTICLVERDKIPLVIKDSNDEKRRKYFLRTGAKTGSGLCLNTQPEPENKKEMQLALQ